MKRKLWHTAVSTNIKYSVLNLGNEQNETFRLEPRQRITSAILAASAAPFQLRGCSRVPRSPKCTMVSLSSLPHVLHLRPVPWRCSDVLSVTSNRRTYSLTGEQEVHTCRNKESTIFLIFLYRTPFMVRNPFMWSGFNLQWWWKKDRVSYLHKHVSM